MNSFFKTFFACLLAIVISGLAFMILSFIMMVGMISLISSGDGGTKKRVAEHSILKIDLSVPIVDKPRGAKVEVFDYSQFGVKEYLSLLDVVTAIDRAKNDPTIDGIYLAFPSGGGIPSSMTTLYEVRKALEDFRGGDGSGDYSGHSGKFVIAYGDVYTQGGYYLASVADKVYMNPQGGMDWRGLSMNQLFFKGTLDKLGIKPELIRHGSFKSAGEPFILDKMSTENRLQYEALIQGMWDQMVGDIAKSRGMEVDELQMYASMLAVETARDGVNLGFLDGLYYRDQIADELAKLTGQEHMERGAKLVGLSEYRNSRGGSTGGRILGSPMSGNKIAVVYAEGDIVDAGDKERQIVGNEVAQVLRKVRKDDNVKAVVFRINSGGGSALASEVIWREVYLTSLAKPTVVSMGELAASGGYYIACGADHIVTGPMTLTGSIGVFGILFNVEQGAREKLGITTDGVRTNRSADLGNIFRPMTWSERVFIQNQVDSVYARFTELVAQGRGMKIGEVDKLGGGRVWLGRQAVANGLADGTGTLTDAIGIAVQSAGLGSLGTGDYGVVTYPEVNTSSFAALFEMMTTSVVAKVMGEIKGGEGGSAMSGLELQGMAKEEIQALEEMVKQQGTVQAVLPYKMEIRD